MGKGKVEGAGVKLWSGVGEWSGALELKGSDIRTFLSPQFIASKQVLHDTVFLALLILLLAFLLLPLPHRLLLSLNHELQEANDPH